MMINLTDNYEDCPVVIKAISEKGFQIWQDEYGDFWAEKDGWDFGSSNPAALLGMIAIYEKINPTFFEENWWKKI